MPAKHVTAENFKTEVLEADQPVLVDFWAPWCGPCRMLSPVIDELSGEVEDAKICKVNVDEEPGLAKKYSIMTIPTLCVFREGEVGEKSSGAISKEQILGLLRG